MPPLGSEPPSVRTSDMNLPICRGGKFTTAITCRPINVSGAEILTGQVVTRALRSHLRKPSPSKALVLSFHGWTGGGKNYVAK